MAPPTGGNTNEPPVPGAAGYALRLSGSGAHADLGATQAALGLDGTGFAFGAWIRTNSDPADSGAVLLSAGPYVIRWSQVRGLHFSAGSQAAASSGKMLNDGAWHYVAASATFDAASISVDGGNATVAVIPQIEGQVAAALVVSATDTVLLGATSTKSSGGFFSGDIDEVLIFNQAKPVTELWAAAGTPAAAAAAAGGVVAVLTFNDCCDSGYLVNAVAGKPQGVVRSGGALVGSSLPVVDAVTVSEVGPARY